MLKIIKGLLGLVIPKEWSVLLEETHITVCFLIKVTNKMTKKVLLRLQILELKDVGWGS